MTTTETFTEHEAQARDRFNDWSESSTFQRLRPWLSYVQRHLMERIDWSRATAVLDVACGSGWAVYESANRLKQTGSGIACGCDISFGMLQQRVGEKYSGGNAFFLAASAQALPYADDTFDAAICTAAFHHFPEPHDALIEIKRVLKPGGKLLITDTCRNQSLGVWVWDRLHRWFEPGHVKYYRTDELLALLNGAQFGNVEVKEYYPTYAQTKKLVSNFAMFSATCP